MQSLLVHLAVLLLVDKTEKNNLFVEFLMYVGLF